MKNILGLWCKIHQYFFWPTLYIVGTEISCRLWKSIASILKPGGKLFLGVYSFDNCIFEYIVRCIRVLGKIIKFEVMFNIAKRFPLFNRFYMDHAYVPVLYLINRKEIIDSSLNSNLIVDKEFPSRSDFFQKIPILGKIISGNGLLRIFNQYLPF